MSERPRVLFSRCLGFEACRYDGGLIRSDFASLLRSHVEVVTICPEVELGLGTPRPTLSLVRSEHGPRMVQARSGQDFTEQMVDWSERRLPDLGVLDGAILKSRSPSCAITDAKLHAGTDEGPVVGRSAGLFTRTLRASRPELACIDEGRVQDEGLRQHWLTRVFSFWRFRLAAQRPQPQGLMDFHARHKYLLMAQNETRLREMGRLLASSSSNDARGLVREYRSQLVQALEKAGTTRRHINVLQHLFGHVSAQLTSAEREHFLSSLDEYRAGNRSLATLQFLLASWALRFDDRYLRDQVYLTPYPVELLN